MHALVTGIGGFAGSHLAEALLAGGWTVQGTLAPNEPRQHLSAVASEVGLSELDIVDAAAVENTVGAADPTCVFHLAGVAFVPDGLADPLGTYDINVGGTFNLLDAVRVHCPAARVVIVGSGDAYGHVDPGRLPIKESQPWNPVNPYGATKAAGDILAATYAQQYGLAIVRARPFNHIGPRQSPRFVCSDFARQIARIERGLQEPVIRVGKLTARRDFLDVRDVVKAYRMLASPEVPPDAYNICSERSVAISDLLTGLLALARVDIRVEEDASRVRPVEVAEHRGSAERLRTATGWAPTVGLQESLADILAYWRAHVDGAA